MKRITVFLLGLSFLLMPSFSAYAMRGERQNNEQLLQNEKDNKVKKEVKNPYIKKLEELKREDSWPLVKRYNRFKKWVSPSWSPKVGAAVVITSCGLALIEAVRSRFFGGLGWIASKLNKLDVISPLLVKPITWKLAGIGLLGDITYHVLYNRSAEGLYNRASKIKKRLDEFGFVGIEFTELAAMSEAITGQCSKLTRYIEHEKELEYRMNFLNEVCTQYKKALEMLEMAEKSCKSKKVSKKKEQNNNSVNCFSGFFNKAKNKISNIADKTLKKIKSNSVVGFVGKALKRIHGSSCEDSLNSKIGNLKKEIAKYRKAAAANKQLVLAELEKRKKIQVVVQ